MPIEYKCACGESMEFSQRYAGKHVRCLYCNAVILISEIKSPPEAEEADYQLSSEDLETPGRTRKQSEPSQYDGWGESQRSKSKKSEDDEDDSPRSQRSKKRERREFQMRLESVDRYERPEYRRPGPSMNFGLVGVGLLMIFGAIVWLIVGLMAGWLFYYPPVLMVLGLISMIKGFLGYEE